MKRFRLIAGTFFSSLVANVVRPLFTIVGYVRTPGAERVGRTIQRNLLSWLGENQGAHSRPAPGSSLSRKLSFAWRTPEVASQPAQVDQSLMPILRRERFVIY